MQKEKRFQKKRFSRPSGIGQAMEMFGRSRFIFSASEGKLKRIQEVLLISRLPEARVIILTKKAQNVHEKGASEDWLPVLSGMLQMIF